jgi:hypothetical protein
VGEIELARTTLDEAHRTLVENLRGVSLEEALDPAGGYRSILGIAKHAAAWSAVYYSYAFEPTPRPWDATDWPRGLRDRIEASPAYLGEVLAWFDRTYQRWLASLAGVDDLDAPRPVHWGGTAPLSGSWRWSPGTGPTTPGRSTRSWRSGAARPGSTARRSRRTTSPPSATACVRPG